MRTWEDNAREFGALARQGRDPRLALLVACSVEVDKWGTGTGKVSMAKFAALAFKRKADDTGSVDSRRVSRHLKAWERAADAGLVPHAADLTPEDAYMELSGDAVAFLSRPGSLGLSGQDQVVADIIANKPALARAIEQDPEVAQAAAEALAERQRGLVVGYLRDARHALDRIIDLLTGQPEHRGLVRDALDETVRVLDEQLATVRLLLVSPDGGRRDPTP